VWGIRVIHALHLIVLTSQVKVSSNMNTS
jgi:hypothetical protein